jgi:uncharacterized membrane protein
MPSARNTVTIGRTVDQVFDFVADGENAMRWRPGVLDVAHVSGSGVGAAYRQGVRGPGGRRIDADYVITAYSPGRRIAFRATAGPVRPEGEYVFEDLGGATRLTFSLQAEVSGWKRLLMGGAVQRTMDDEVRTIERIEGLLGA